MMPSSPFNRSSSQQSTSTFPQRQPKVHINNPLRHQLPKQVKKEAQLFHRKYGLQEVVEKDLFLRGALVARNPGFLEDEGLTYVEKLALERESSSENENGLLEQIKLFTKEFRTNLTTCCVAAIVQGWDQSSINGANLGWPSDFGLSVDLQHPGQNAHDVWIFGIVNASSYLSAALVGCWLSDPLNEHVYGRRGALFVAGCFSFASVIGAAYTTTWKQLLACRILLGLGIGAKASVVAVYIAETSPTFIRGSLVILWQMFVAFGIFCGDTANLVVFTSWRKQLASPFIPAVLLLTLVPLCTESPRWLLKQGRIKDAYIALRHLRQTPLQACRDLYLMHVRVQGEIVYLNRHKRNRNVQMQLKETASSGNKSEGADIREKSPEEENAIGMEDGMEGTNNGQELYQQEVRLSSYRQRFLQLFTVPRIRRAAQAGFAVMIAQQLCGINILAFLSSTIFADASESSPVTTSQSLRDIYNLKALWMSFGFGLSNFVFTWLAWGNIDKKGRRFLLNWSFPCMCITLLGAALSFLISHDRESLRLGFIVLFVILFTIAYSAGEGPVAFTLSSEVFPLLNREVGMSFSVFWNLLGAGIVALTVPQLAYALKPTGLLGLFAGLNLVAWALVFFLVPETAQENLENMNDIFEVSTIEHFRYRIVCLKWSFNYYIRKRDPDRSDEPDPLAVWAKERERRWGDETRRAWSAGVSS